jgi:hypothetical protein
MTEKLDSDWVVVLLGNRNLIGKYKFDEQTRVAILNPVYQIEMVTAPETVIDPVTKRTNVVMKKGRNITALAEIDGFTSCVLPGEGYIKKYVNGLSEEGQTEMHYLVVNYERVVAETQRQRKIAKDATEASRIQSFGGGARKE